MIRPLKTQPASMTRFALILAAGTALLTASAALAQQQHGGHGQPAKTEEPAEPASTKAFRAASDKMHKSMAIPFSGNADIDFFKGMIPHHQGAIDMARVILEHGKDPETKKMAQEIIAAQEKEIAFMREWLKKNGQ